MDWRMRFVLCALALAGAANAWAFWPFGGAEKGPFVIAEEGVAKAAIVVRTEGRAKGYRYAANELADYLGRMTGARFAVVNEPLAGLATIRVGTDYVPSKTDELHIVKDMTVELVPSGASPVRFLDMRDVHLIPAAMLH